MRQIITDKPMGLCATLTEAFESGVTKIDVTGGYSNEPKTMIYFIINRFRISKMREIVHELDPKAYITISEVTNFFATNKNV